MGGRWGSDWRGRGAAKDQGGAGGTEGEGLLSLSWAGALNPEALVPKVPADFVLQWPSAGVDTLSKPAEWVPMQATLQFSET